MKNMNIENEEKKIIQDSQFLSDFLQKLNLILEEVIRALNEKQINEVDEVLLGLFKSLIYKSDSFLVLYEEMKFSGIEVLSRSIFETATTICFILNDDGKAIIDRAWAYKMVSFIDNLNKYELCASNKKHAKDVRELMGIDKKSAKEILEKRSNDYKGELNKYYSKINKNIFFKWYSINNERISSFSKVCKELGNEFESYYEVMYSLFSKGTHGTDSYNYFRRSSKNEINYEVGNHESLMDLASLSWGCVVFSLEKAFNKGTIFYANQDLKTVMDENFVNKTII